MCLTAQALMAFLNLLPSEIIEHAGDRIIVSAETRDVVWVAKGENWCTDGPSIDAADRAKPGIDT